jgi:hypothetical protein
MPIHHLSCRSLSTSQVASRKGKKSDGELVGRQKATKPVISWVVLGAWAEKNKTVTTATADEESDKSFFWMSFLINVRLYCSAIIYV